MAAYLVTVKMVFPDDIHAEDIKHIAESRLGRAVHSINPVKKRKAKHGRKVRQ